MRSTPTGLAIFAIVEVANIVAPAAIGTATTQTCPRTGCTASYCHATQGGGAGNDGGYGTQRQGQAQEQGQGGVYNL